MASGLSVFFIQFFCEGMRHTEALMQFSESVVQLVVSLSKGSRGVNSIIELWFHKLRQALVLVGTCYVVCR